MIENLKVFRETMQNFARTIQMELKLLDLNGDKQKS